MPYQQAIERRVTNLLNEFWKYTCQEDAPPRQEVLEAIPQIIQDVWGACFVVSVESLAEGANNYTYNHLGRDIHYACTEELGVKESPPMAGIQASRLHRFYEHVITYRQPVTVESELLSSKGKVVKFRQCLMPFVNHKNEVTAILGGMRFRMDEFASVA